VVLTAECTLHLHDAEPPLPFMFPQSLQKTRQVAALPVVLQRNEIGRCPSCIDLVHGFQVKTDLRLLREEKCEEGRESGAQLFQSANRQDGVLFSQFYGVVGFVHIELVSVDIKLPGATQLLDDGAGGL